MERNGLAPANGPVIVTGATGGVGSMAVEFLSTLGYEVTALTGKDDEHEYLRSLGATSVLSRGGLQMGTRPIEKSTWAGAVDPSGGEILAWLPRTMKPGGCIASLGLTAGVELRTTVLPFILRGVSLLGIDSVVCAMDRRRDVWHRVATTMRLKHLTTIAREVTLSGRPDAVATLLKGASRGRMVVKIA